MILDILENAKFHVDRNKGFEKAFEFLARPDLKDLAAGKYEIDGDRVYAMVQIGPGREKEGALLEAHRDYIDIQLVLEGLDEMGWKATSTCVNPKGEYIADDDARLYSDSPDAWITVGAGSFVVFYPADAHMPSISDGQLHKVVIKVPFADV